MLASIGLRRHGPADGSHSPDATPYLRRSTTQPKCVKCTFLAGLRLAALVANDLPNGERHLAALREICLVPCEELGDLEKAVQQYRVKARP
jgi:hypothetical protein